MIDICGHFRVVAYSINSTRGGDVIDILFEAVPQPLRDDPALDTTGFRSNTDQELASYSKLERLKFTPGSAMRFTSKVYVRKRSDE